MKFSHLVIFSLIAISFLISVVYIKSFPLEQATEKEEITAAAKNNNFPLRLQIPHLDVDTTIQHVGVTAEGEMDVPSNPQEVGWFTESALPGEVGSSVMAGHLNGDDGEAGVFANLHKLTVGDKLYIYSDTEEPVIFIVKNKSRYKPGFANEVFDSAEGIHLNLITCDGEWDAATKTYSSRLVVFADILKE